MRMSPTSETSASSPLYGPSPMRAMTAARCARMVTKTWPPMKTTSPTTRIARPIDPPPREDNAVEAIESRLHHWRAAAIDIDGGAGDVGCRIGNEKTGEVREFLGPPDAADRDVLDARVDVVLEWDAGLLRGAHVLIGLDETDQQRIHQHVMGCALACEHLGQRHAGGTGDGGRRALRPRRLGADIENVDHASP